MLLAFPFFNLIVDKEIAIILNGPLIDMLSLFIMAI
jgi:hypothetical protein